MALSPTLVDREQAKFVDVSGATAVRVFDLAASGGGGLSPPPNTDTVVASYPDAVTEVYQYKSGGVSGTLLATVTVVYTTAAKDLISTVVKT